MKIKTKFPKALFFFDFFNLWKQNKHKTSFKLAAKQLRKIEKNSSQNPCRKQPPKPFYIGLGEN